MMKAANQNDELKIICVFNVSLANSQRILKPSLASFLATALVRTTTNNH